ncbi:hypothetical protein F5Y18DRAFT_428745 [Xylariaceae sp. FL1019]|nr:hypothetical protein F5Y18DRAFT_428745 [Xylariaceae sp. FL1019]
MPPPVPLPVLVSTLRSTVDSAVSQSNRWRKWICSFCSRDLDMAAHNPIAISGLWSASGLPLLGGPSRKLLPSDTDQVSAQSTPARIPTYACTLAYHTAARSSSVRH